jgi:tetratricopeptide (TPR) repeat protein
VRTLRSFVLTLAALAIALPLAAAPASQAEAERALQQGVNHTRLDEVLAARASFQTLANLEPRSAVLFYWIALADWRAVPLMMVSKEPGQKDAARRRCDAGLTAIGRALALDPKSADALALEAGLLGLSTSFHSAADLMSIGTQTESDFDRARTLAPNNPRVFLIDGINTLHKPAFVGGGAKPAQAKFARAIECFAAQDSTAPGPRWGADDAWAWAGRAALAVADTAGARRCFARALELNPDSRWVRAVLMPQVGGPTVASR